MYNQEYKKNNIDYKGFFGLKKNTCISYSFISRCITPKVTRNVKSNSSNINKMHIKGNFLRIDIQEEQEVWGTKERLVGSQSGVERNNRWRMEDERIKLYTLCLLILSILRLFNRDLHASIQKVGEVYDVFISRKRRGHNVNNFSFIRFGKYKLSEEEIEMLDGITLQISQGCRDDLQK